MEVDNMALYLADGIEEGRLDYLAVFKISRYTILKDSVDAMLVADGFQDKIVPIV
jgi:hypothetical protein